MSRIDETPPTDAIDDLEWLYKQAASEMGHRSNLGPQLDRLRAGTCGSKFVTPETDDDRRIDAIVKHRNVTEVLWSLAHRHQRIAQLLHEPKSFDGTMRKEFGVELVAIVAVTDIAKRAYREAQTESYARPECVFPWLEGLVVRKDKRTIPLLSEIKVQASFMRVDVYRAYETARAHVTEANGGRRKAYPSNVRRERAAA